MVERIKGLFQVFLKMNYFQLELSNFGAFLLAFLAVEIRCMYWILLLFSHCDNQRGGIGPSREGSIVFVYAIIVSWIFYKIKQNKTPGNDYNIYEVNAHWIPPFSSDIVGYRSQRHPYRTIYFPARVWRSSNSQTTSFCAYLGVNSRDELYSVLLLASEFN